MARHLQCLNKRPTRSRLDEPFVVRNPIMWSGKLYKPGYKIPKEMRESRVLRLRWWERRKIVPVADVISGLRAKPKKDDAPPANPQPEPPANPPANEGDGDGDNEGATANPQPDAGDGDNGGGDQGSQSE